MRLQEIGVYPQAFETIRAPVVMLHGAAEPHPGEMIAQGWNHTFRSSSTCNWSAAVPIRGLNQRWGMTSFA
jgi:hypothetical protein